MKIYVGVTDTQWFDYLRGLSSRLAFCPADRFYRFERLDKANSWEPSCRSRFFRFILPDEPVIFDDPSVPNIGETPYAQGD